MTFSSPALPNFGSLVGVTFSGPAISLVPNYPSYTPNSTFADGTIVDNAPVPANNIIQLFGGTDALNTVTFATPVVNPVMAIWSLGQGGFRTRADWDRYVAAEPVSFAVPMAKR